MSQRAVWVATRERESLALGVVFLLHLLILAFVLPAVVAAVNAFRALNAEVLVKVLSLHPSTAHVALHQRVLMPAVSRTPLHSTRGRQVWLASVREHSTRRE